MTGDPLTRISEAHKQLKLAARDLEGTQETAAHGLADVVDALAASVAWTREDDDPEVRTDGGVDVDDEDFTHWELPEAGCNCEHLADDATCIHCTGSGVERPDVVRGLIP